MMIALGVLATLVLLALRIPIAIALAMVALGSVAIELQGRLFEVAVQVMVDGLDSFVLIAAPFFMLAAQIMNQGGMTRRIFRFANALVGWMPGGLGQVNIVASMLFSGMTGSAISDAVGLGTMEISAMRERGYDPDLSAAVTAASSIIGPIVPPSVPMVIYGAIASASIGSLFLAGLIPGLLMGAALMATVFVYSFLGKAPRGQRTDLVELRRSAAEALPSLMTPLIVVGGIYSGLFTPTEAAVVATAYALIVTAIYREITWRALREITVYVIVTAGALFFIVASTSLLGWVIARSGAMVDVALWLGDAVESQTALLFIIAGLYLVVGLFMEPIAALLLLVPILLPAVKILGIDLVHFGVITVLSLCLGLLTPPVGLVLYAVAGVADLRVHRLMVAVLPFLAPLVLVLVLIIAVPDLVLFLPKYLYALRLGL